MASYSVRLDRRVRKKDLARLPKRDARQIAKTIGALVDEPRPAGAEKLTARPEYRIMRGRYRILFTVDDESRTVTVHRVARRREAYR